MKKPIPFLLFCLALLLCLYPALASAEGEEQKCGDNLYWSLDSTTGVLTITGSGAMENFGWDAQPWKQIADEITSLSLPSGLAAVGDRAFTECTGLITVAIPSTVITIGDWAFHNCSGLISITIPNSITTI